MHSAEARKRLLACNLGRASEACPADPLIASQNEDSLKVIVLTPNKRYAKMGTAMKREHDFREMELV